MIMTKLVDCRLLWKAAEFTRQWFDPELKNRVREDFVAFAKPYWMERGGINFVNHMVNKYIDNDEQSIVEYLYNLDKQNQEVVVRYLLSKADRFNELVWTVGIENE